VLRWAVLYAAQSECMTVIVQIEGLHLAWLLLSALTD
jgi:hypothetical protein